MWPMKAASTCRDIRRSGRGSTVWRVSRGMCRSLLLPDGGSVRQPDFQRPFPGLRIVMGEVEQAELPRRVPPAIELAQHFRQSRRRLAVGGEEEADAAG